MLSASSLQELTTKHDALSGAWKKKDQKKVGALLEDLKLLMLEMAFLPTQGDLENHKKELILARDVLEIGAFFSIQSDDADGFERFMAQLKTYYLDYAQFLPVSVFQHELLGLNLMCLLSKNQIAEFHTELERLQGMKDESMTSQNAYISTPVKLEQFVMEGSYNKVMLMKESIPAEPYSYFIDKLLVTIRDEIASCVEKAYEKISLNDAVKMMQVDQKEVNKYISERGWLLGKDGYIRFRSGERLAPSEEIPTEELAKMSIAYAREMEQIV